MGEKKHKSRLLALEQLQRANRHIEALERNLDRIWNALGKPVGNGPDRVIPMLNRIYTLTRAEAEMKAVQQTLTVDAAEGQPLPPISTEARVCAPVERPTATASGLSPEVEQAIVETFAAGISNEDAAEARRLMQAERGEP